MCVCMPALSCLVQEMRGLQEHIYFGRLDDEQSVVESLLDMHQSVGRWNPRVLGVGDSSSSEADAQTVRVCVSVLRALAEGICVDVTGYLSVRAARPCPFGHVSAWTEMHMHMHRSLNSMLITCVVIHTMPCSPGWLKPRCRPSQCWHRPITCE